MQPESSSTVYPFVINEALFYFKGGSRAGNDYQALRDYIIESGGRIDAAVQAAGDPAEGQSRALDDSPAVWGDQEPLQPLSQSYEDGEPPITLVPATYEPSDQSPFDLLLSLSNGLKERGLDAVVQPNWLIGAGAGGPIGGSGAGPGARPVPVALQPLPFDTTILEPLRNQADSTRGNVRLVVLDAWNGDSSESGTLASDLSLLTQVNDGCWGAQRQWPERLLPVNGDRIATDDDPFPMPDHGIFTTYLATEVVGLERLHLRGTGNGGSNSYVSVEGWRVLDENGAGESKVLIEALEALTESILADPDAPRIVVNLSLIITFPDIPPRRCRPEGWWPEEWGPQPPESFIIRLPGNAPDDAERLDAALHAAIRRLAATGALIVAAAGNASHGPTDRRTASYPAAYEEVLCVTAAAYDGSSEAWYANLATPDSVALYAGDVDATDYLSQDQPVIGPFTDANVPIKGAGIDPPNADGAVAWAGTSFATPQASGLACLLWAAQPSASAADIRTQLRALADGRVLPRPDGNGGQSPDATPYVQLLRFDEGA